MHRPPLFVIAVQWGQKSKQQSFHNPLDGFDVTSIDSGGLRYMFDGPQPAAERRLAKFFLEITRDARRQTDHLACFHTLVMNALKTKTYNGTPLLCEPVTQRHINTMVAVKPITGDPKNSIFSVASGNGKPRETMCLLPENNV